MNLHALLPFVLPVLFALVIVAVLPLVAGYIVLVERKVMADMQVRLGPMRVGPHGLLQPIADAVKLLLKEDIIPESADKLIFWGAPLISVTAAMLALAALPIGPFFQIADLNIGLLFILGVSSLGIFGIVLGGWASNSHYSLLGALRSAAQLVSYETSAGMAVVGALLLAGTLSTRAIVQAQTDDGVWFIFAAPVGFFIYLVASIAETNRAPFDMPEAESELVAGYMTEYSGFRWALYFLAEYTNMVVVASIATTLFLGGWLRPFAGYVRSSIFSIIFPPLLMLWVAGYCFYRAPKQPVPVQKLFMVAVGLLCIVVALILLSCPWLAPAGSSAGLGEAGNCTARSGFCSRCRRVHLRVHVAAVHVSALPLRSVDAPGLAIPGAAFDRERDGHRRGPRRCTGSWAGRRCPSLLLRIVRHAGSGGLSGVGWREARTCICRGRGREAPRMLNEAVFYFFAALAVVSGDSGGDAPQRGAERDFPGDGAAGHGGNFPERCTRSFCSSCR